jgi:hypothetical protein
MVRRLGFSSSRRPHRLVRFAFRRRRVVRRKFVNKRRRFSGRRFRGKRTFRRGQRRFRVRRFKRRREMLLNFFVKTVMPPAVASLDPLQITNCPVSSTTVNNQQYTTGNAVCKIASGLPGMYCYDFLRGAYANYGAIANNFRQIKFGTARLTIRRVDAGSNSGIMTSSADENNFSTFNFGSSPTVLKMYYKYLGPNEHSSMYVNPSNIICDPKTRCKYLRVGRKISFKFRAMQYMEKKISTITRYGTDDGSGYAGSAEDTNCRTLSIPTSYKRLGWIPAPVGLGQSDPFYNFTSSAAWTTNAFPGGYVPGVGSGIDFRILGPTIVYCFDWDGAGAFSTVISGITYTYGPFSLPLVHLQESLSFSVKGLRAVGNTLPNLMVTIPAYPLPPDGSFQAQQERAQLTWNRVYPNPPENIDSMVITSQPEDEVSNTTVGAYPTVSRNLPPVVP